MGLYTTFTCYSSFASTKFYDELSREGSGGAQGGGGGGGGDAGGEESSVDRPSQEEAEACKPTAVATKMLELSHISVEVGGRGEGK